MHHKIIGTMKNLAFILILVLGASATVFAQDGRKQTEPSKEQVSKPQKGASKKKREIAPKKEEAPAKKVN
jgi:hypothetical protein